MDGARATAVWHLPFKSSRLQVSGRYLLISSFRVFDKSYSLRLYCVPTGSEMEPMGTVWASSVLSAAEIVGVRAHIISHAN